MTMLFPGNQIPGSGCTQSCLVPVPRSIGHHVEPILCYSYTWIFTTSGPLIFFHVVLIGIHYGSCSSVHSDAIGAFCQSKAGCTLTYSSTGIIFGTVNNINIIFFYNRRRIKGITLFPVYFLLTHGTIESCIRDRPDYRIRSDRPYKPAQGPLRQNIW